MRQDPHFLEYGCCNRAALRSVQHDHEGEALPPKEAGTSPPQRCVAFDLRPENRRVFGPAVHLDRHRHELAPEPEQGEQVRDDGDLSKAEFLPKFPVWQAPGNLELRLGCDARPALDYPEVVFDCPARRRSKADPFRLQRLSAKGPEAVEVLG